MSFAFRPQDYDKRYVIRCRLTGERIYSSIRERRDGDLRPICRTFSRLHHLGCHAPLPVQKKWRPAYRRLMNRLVPVNGTVRYINTWSAERWL